MKRLASVLVLTLAVIGLTACPKAENQNTTSTNATTASGTGSDAITTAAVARARESIGAVADTMVKAADTANHAGRGNAEITSAIKYYESLSAGDRIKAVVTDHEK